MPSAMVAIADHVRELASALGETMETLIDSTMKHPTHPVQLNRSSRDA